MSNIKPSSVNGKRGLSPIDLPIDPTGYGALVFGISDSFSHKGRVSTEKGQLQLQYSFHCPSTFVRPHSVKRVSHLLCRRLPNTGSTVANRAAIVRLPSVESLRRFIRSANIWGLTPIIRFTGPVVWAT
jgi:hypothetical protein